MMFEEFLTGVMTTLGFPDLQTTGTFLALIITAVMVFSVYIASGGRKGAANIGSVVIAFFLSLTFTVFEWYPAFTGAAIAFCMALIGAHEVSKLVK